jgi:endogenous inhibitor of DNA gyrase (YacG/DUF329 family)
MKQPDLFSIYVPCKECGKLFHRVTKRRIFCSHTCGKKSNNRLRQHAYDEFKSSKIAAE